MITLMTINDTMSIVYGVAIGPNDAMLNVTSSDQFDWTIVSLLLQEESLIPLSSTTR